MNVLSVVGARPQFVKAAPVSKALRERHEECLVHTGQHYDTELSDVFFEELDIPDPEHHLGVGSGSHGSQTAEMMVELEELIEAEQPDVVLTYGDTNSTLAAAIVASKASPALAHVEAGLRSHNFEMPEEINRRLTDHCSDVLFTPSPRSAEQLRSEGITDGVHCAGDVMFDTLLQVRDRLDAIVRESVDVPDEYVLATVHRPGNTDDRARLEAIVAGLERAPYPVVLPAHPRTVEALEEYDLYEWAADAIDLIDPVGYPEFVGLVQDATAVATDSGGVQKEAFYLDTPCVTMREETEWVETVDAGWNVLVGADEELIVRELSAAGDTPPKPDLYGSGNAAQRIVGVLEERFA